MASAKVKLLKTTKVIDVKWKRSYLSKFLARRNLNYGVEVGVCTGAFSKELCQNHPKIKLVGVDDYGVTELRARRVGEEGQSVYLERAKKLLAPYNWRHIREPSMVAVLRFGYGSLDFVYIDGGHSFDYVMCDIIEWARKVKHGGIVAGHDYYNFVNGGVIDAVNTYCNIHRIGKLYLTDGRTNEGGDRRRSWFFRKR